jgi:hypothetical protein
MASILRFKNPRWHRSRRTKPSAQIYDAAPYETQVIEFEHDVAEAERQLEHANRELERLRHYPGRDR